MAKSTENTEKATVKKYTVVGSRFNKDGKKYLIGDKIELTPKEYEEVKELVK